MGRVPTIYYCPYENCSASYDRKHRYETHIRSHTGERPFICSHEGCGKSFASSSHLKRHEDAHGPSYRCTIEDCPEVLKTKATLKKHIKKVHLKKHKVYTCTQCFKEFKKHNVLQKHELRHSGQLPYKCSVEDCQKTFLTPSKLKRHMKVHEGYPCKVLGCDKVFEKWTLFVQHARDFHRPEYKCLVCNKLFSTSYALKLHVPLHEESRLVYPCEVPNCSRYYYAERNLKWHMRKYHAKRPFMCDKENCHRAFKTEADLAEHVLYHGRKKPRKKKNKPKKPKPSLAAILSGFAEVEQMNRKSKQVLIEEKIESNVTVSSSKFICTDLELDTTKLSFVEPNLSVIMEETPCILTNERNINCAPSKSISVQMLFESCQTNASSDMDISSNSNINDGSFIESKEIKLSSKENILEMGKSINAEEVDTEYSIKNHIVQIDCKINNSSTNLEVLESAVQDYTTVEIIGGENPSQFISVPIIQIDTLWDKNVPVHIETVS